MDFKLKKYFIIKKTKMDYNRLQWVIMDLICSKIIDYNPLKIDYVV